MTDWFARPVLHVSDVETSLHFYIDRLGFTSPWRYEENGRARVAQVDRQGFALILADTWPDKIGKGLMFISLNVEPETRTPRLRRSTRGARSSKRAALVSDHAAALDAQYEPCIGALNQLTTDRMLTSAPPPFFFSTGAKARHIASMPK